MEQWHPALALEVKFLKAMRTPTLNKQLLPKVIPRRWANAVTRDAMGKGIRLIAQYVMRGVLNFPLTQKVYIELPEEFRSSGNQMFWLCRGFYRLRLAPDAEHFPTREMIKKSATTSVCSRSGE